MWVHPNAAGGIFEATGRGGQRITVLPSKQIVLAITGGGFDPGEIARFLFDSVKSDGAPLPENPAAAATLRAAIMAAAEAPGMTAGQPAVSGIPDLVRRISGRRYEVESNPWGLRSFRFRFSARSAPRLELTFGDAHSETVKIGMNGAPVLSRVGAHRALVSGSFAGPDTLVVDYNQIARINDIELQFRFNDAGGVGIQLFEKTDHARYAFSARRH